MQRLGIVTRKDVLPEIIDERVELAEEEKAIEIRERAEAGPGAAPIHPLGSASRPAAPPRARAATRPALLTPTSSRGYLNLPPTPMADSSKHLSQTRACTALFPGRPLLFRRQNDICRQPRPSPLPVP